MNWRRKLANPFLLAFEGFVLGGLLFVAVNPDIAESRTHDAAEAVIASLQR